MGRSNRAKQRRRERRFAEKMAGGRAARAPQAGLNDMAGRLRGMLWRPSYGEARAVIFALAVKSVFTLAMLAFGHNHAEIIAAFDLQSWFPGEPNNWNRWYTRGAPVWYAPLAHWDGQHYLLLADWGYNIQYDNTGGKQFYPLYPLAIRAFSLVFSPAVSALLLNYLFVGGFCAFLYRTGAHFGCRWPALSVVMVMAFPTAFFTSAFYSEPLFLFLLGGFFHHFFCTKNRRAYLLFFALLPLSRGSAAFVFGGLALCALLEFARFFAARRAAHAAEEPAAAPQMFAWRPYAECAAVFVLGAVAYLAFFQIVVGDAFVGIKAQARANTGNSIANIFNPAHFWDILTAKSMDAKWFSIYHARSYYWIMWITLAACAAFAALREWKLLCFYFSLVYCHAAMGDLAGHTRYMLAAMPFLALALAKHARRRQHAAMIYALCAAMFALQLYLAARYAMNLWV
ncbi:MAG: hypothetical protein MPJ81_02465 [Gammaproteobacteria bacterium]|nr:hypothetical protein [Gammaproteobacteria bacterium]